MRVLLALFFGQAFNFLLIVVNIRACAKGLILAAVVTDFLICVLGFTLIRLIADAGTPTEVLAYALGGSSGSALAIWVTRRWDA
ncbi:MAG TPA: hypothetical protein VMZ90_03510 [Vicinamibacterales bacterium]|nr:hypothetical protein [Vicinamibacterales bacterium]